MSMVCYKCQVLRTCLKKKLEIHFSRKVNTFFSTRRSISDTKTLPTISGPLSVLTPNMLFSRCATLEVLNQSSTFTLSEMKLTNGLVATTTAATTIHRSEFLA